MLLLTPGSTRTNTLVPSPTLFGYSHPRADVVDGESIALQHLAAQRGGAEAVDAQHVAAVADIAMPALRRAGLHRQPRWHGRWQHGFAVLDRKSTRLNSSH